MYMEEHICTLAKEYNHCPHFDGKQFCTSPETSCGMLLTQKNPKKYVREERWYEQYYKKSR